MPRRVLITGAGTATCQSVVKGLRASDDQPWLLVVDMDELNAGRHLADAFRRVPAAEDDGFSPALLDIVREEEIEVVIPIVDYEFLALADMRQALHAAGCYLVLAGTEALRTCVEKDLTYAALHQAGIPTPRVWSRQEAMRAGSVTFPACVKPRCGRASLGVGRVENVSELSMHLATERDVIVQPWIEGREYTVDCLLDAKDQVVITAVRERLATKAGVSVKGCVVDRPRVAELAVQAVAAAGVDGPSPVNVQVLEAVSDGSLWVSDMNPRFSAGLALTIAAGANIPHWLLRLLDGATLSPGDGIALVGTTMARYWQEVIFEHPPEREL